MVEEQLKKKVRVVVKKKCIKYMGYEENDIVGPIDIWIDQSGAWPVSFPSEKWWWKDRYTSLGRGRGDESKLDRDRNVIGGELECQPEALTFCTRR